jgi:hypothetical protein
MTSSREEQDVLKSYQLGVNVDAHQCMFVNMYL